MYKPKNYLRFATFIISLIFLTSAQASEVKEELQKPTFRQTAYNVGSTIGQIGWGFAKSLVKEVKTDEGETLYPLIPIEALIRDLSSVKSHIQKTPAKDLAKEVGTAFKDHPLDIAALAVMLGTSIQGEEANAILLISSNTLGRINAIKFVGSLFYAAAKKQNLTSMVSSSGMKRLAIGGVLLYLSGSAAAEAGAFNSLGDYAKYFSGGPCTSEPISRDLDKVINCLKNSQDLGECRSLVSETPLDKVHFKIFSLHQGKDGSNAVSCAEFGPDGKSICYYSSLRYEGAETAVTKLCFPDASKPEHTIEIVRDVSMKVYLEGLKPGISRPVTAIFRSEHEACSSHSLEQPLKTPETGSQVCAYSQPKAGEPVTELCYDPLHPGRVSVKEVDESVLPQGATPSVPRSIVRVPRVIPCPEPHISLLGGISKAIHSWWYQEATTINFKPCEPTVVYEEVSSDSLGKKEL